MKTNLRHTNFKLSWMPVVAFLFMLTAGLFSSNVAYATDCPGATVMPAAPAMPYVITLSCGTTNDITDLNSTACGSNYYKTGWEAVYAWTPASSYTNVSFAYTGQTWTGIFLYEGCPTSGGICIGNFTSSGASKILSYIGTNMLSGTTISLTGGVTYYIVVDTYPAPDSPCPGTLAVNGTSATPCSGPPAPGNTISSLNPVCSGVNFSLSLQNGTPGAGVTYQWQTSPNGLAPWTNVGTSVPIHITSQTLATYYRCEVTCSGITVASTPLLVNMNTLCYCASSSASLSFEYIGGVVATGGINNMGTPHTYYTDYSNLVSTIQAGTPMTVVVSGTSWYSTDSAFIFIDYNQDGDFLDAGELAGRAGGATSPYTINFTIPLTASAGLTGMRVKFGDMTGTVAMNNSPCQIGYTWGETEDYSVNILPAPSCFIPTNITATPGADSVVFSWTSSGPAWQLEIGPQGFPQGFGMRFFVPTNPVIAYYIPDGCYDVYIRTICAPGDTSSWTTTPVTFCICNSVYTLPYFEGFEGPMFPPLCWSQTINNTGDPTTTWHQNSEVTPEGLYCASVFYDIVLNPQDEWLYSPTFDLTGTANPAMGFVWSGSKTWSMYPYNNCDLNVYISNNDGPWVKIWDQFDTDTATYVSWTWRTVEIPLIPNIGNKVQFAFQYFGTDGAQFNIDSFYVKDPPYLDLAVIQSDVEDCDTIGLFAPPITFANVGNIIAPGGSTINITYQINGGPLVMESQTLLYDLNPGDSMTLFFATPTLLNLFTTYNAMFAIDYDLQTANDTALFTATFHGYPTVNLGSDTMVCGSAPVNLDAGNPGSTYNWWDGSNGQTHPVDVTYCGVGDTCRYWVRVTDTYGCSKRDTINIAFNAVPSPPLYGNNNVCVGSTNVYNTNAAMSNYIWSISGGGTIVGGGTVTDNTVTVTWNNVATDTISINYTEDGCTAVLPNSQSVFVHAFPVVDLGVDTTICANQSITLDAGNPTATFDWWNGSTAQTYLLDSAFCGLGTCLFYVDVDLLGCVTRDSIYITWDLCTGINETQQITTVIMPNPTNGVFTIDFGGLTGNTVVEIMDMNGKAVISKILELTGVERTDFDLSSFAKGIYNIRIINGNQVSVQKIILY